MSIDRIVAVALAYCALLLGAHGTTLPETFGIVLLLVPIGAAQAIAASAQGQLALAVGAAKAAFVNFAIGAIILSVIVAVMAFDGLGPPGDPNPPTWAWAGGFIGAIYLITSSRMVIHIGVLRLYLGVVTGQFMAALVLDSALPTPEGPATASRLAAVVLMSLAALVASGMFGRRAVRPMAADQPPPL